MLPEPNRAARRPPVKLVASGRPSAAERAKQSFMAAVSHELRTPLNAIIGFVEIMEAELLGPIENASYRGYVLDILLSSRHLLQVIEDVLATSQAEAGQLVLRKSEVDAAELVDRALSGVVADEAAAKSVTIEADVPRDLVVRVDPARIERAIACLLSNAVKFSDDGGRVQLSAALGPDGRLHITVRDQGIGMEKAAINRAFIPFVQLKNNLSRPYGGAGLGLPLARLLAELHGGSLELDSRPGRGTVATLTLPPY